MVTITLLLLYRRWRILRMRQGLSHQGTTTGIRVSLDISIHRYILKAMDENHKKTFTISLRLPDGWSKPVPNQDPERCDLDSARLWIGPGCQIYCDLVHLRSESE